MYVAITSPYPRDWGVTQWYQSLGSHLVWVTTWINTRALTNSTSRFRFKLVCICIWEFQQILCHWRFIPWLFSIPSWRLSTRISDFLLAFFSSSCFQSLLSFHLLASNPLVLVHYHTSSSRVPYRYQSVQRMCRGPVTFRLWDWQYCSHTWMEIARMQFFVRWGEM